MEDIKNHLRHCILWEFDKGSNATQASRNLCEVFGKDSISERQCRNWFQRFRTGNLSLKDEPRPGRTKLYNDKHLKEFIKANPGKSTYALAKELGASQSTVFRYLRSFEQTPNTEIANTQ